MSMDAYDRINQHASSNCCGAAILMPDLCSDCGEHCEDDADEVEPKIVTRHILPPIPERSHDWHAYLDGQEESGPQGFGHTEEGAIADLKEQMEESKP